MPLLKSDIDRLVKLGHDPNKFRVVVDGVTRLANRESTRACYFLETDSVEIDAPGTCTVWDARPEGCRIYPLVLDQNDKPFLDELCPHTDAFPEPHIGMIGRLFELAQRLEE